MIQAPTISPDDPRLTGRHQSISETTAQKLLVVADLMKLVPESKFNLDYWVALREEPTRDEYGWEEYPLLSEELKNAEEATPELITTHCGSCACAIGWAASVRAFNDQGFDMRSAGQISRLAGFEPHYQDVWGEHHYGMDAVAKFFEIPHERGEWLFYSSGYPDEVDTTPMRVSQRIEAYLRVGQDNMGYGETSDC